MKTVLLFGARSFIGGHIARKFLEDGYQVILHSSSSTQFINLSEVISNPQVSTLSFKLDDLSALRMAFS